MNRSDLRYLHRELFKWWASNKRPFPWRNTRNAYRVLVGEVLLHRTRAGQVAPVYAQMVRRYPSPAALGDATLSELQEVMSSLGLSWRIRLMHQMGRDLVERFDGDVPKEQGELESLPGVSHYIASAVQCFAYGFPVPLLDTNTVRIAGRLLGVEVTDGSRRSKRFRTMLASLLDEAHPREFNFGLIDLGALVCKSQNPECGICPLLKVCRLGQVHGQGAAPR